MTLPVSPPRDARRGQADLQAAARIKADDMCLGPRNYKARGSSGGSFEPHPLAPKLACLSAPLAAPG